MIAKNNKTIVGAFFKNTSIVQVYKGETLVFDTLKVPQITTQLAIDQTKSSPSAMITGTLGKDGDPTQHVVSWVRANSHRFVGTYNSSLGMVLKQLDDNNGTMYADGTSAAQDIKNKDVFMKMPTFWFRGEQTATNKYNIYFSAVQPTDNNTWVKWDGNILIGVYEGICDDTGNNFIGNLFSRSGGTPTVNVCQAYFKDKARNRSVGDDHFQLVTYEAHQVMALLYACYYGNLDGQTVIGSGTSSYPKTTGLQDALGMQDTVAENSTSINFWGLENWWGDISELVDNMISTGGSLYDCGVDVLNYTDRTVHSLRSTNETFYAKEMILGECLDLLPAPDSQSGSRSTYYCDNSYVHPSPGYIAIRSSNGSDSGGGPFAISVGFLSDTADYSIGSRLLYSGRVVIDKGTQALVSSVKVNPIAAVMTVSKARSVNPVTAKIVLKGQNLDKLESTFSNLPEGITISELSEGVTERTAVVTSNLVENLESLKFSLSGYDFVITNPDNLPADLQNVLYKGQPVLRTGMDFHICNVQANNLDSIKLDGLHLDSSKITASVPENSSVLVSISTDGELTVAGQDSLDGLAIVLTQKEQVLGTIRVHSSSEDEVLAKLRAEQETRRPDEAK